MEPNQGTIPNNNSMPIMSGGSDKVASSSSSPASMLITSSGNKSGKILMILGFVLLFLIAVGGVGFGVWAMMDSENQRRQYETEINTLKEQNAKLSEEIEKASDEEIKEDVIVVEMDAWDTYVESMRNNSVYAGGRNKYNGRSAKTNDGKLSVMGNDTEIYKMDDVISVYIVELSEGSIPYLYAIRGDGSVYRTNLTKPEISFERVGDYTKIVSVVTSGDYYALLIDIDGNIYKTI